jgi:hypothetical protein
MTTFMQPLYIYALGCIQISPKISCCTNTKNLPPCSHNPLTGYNPCMCNPFYYCQANIKHCRSTVLKLQLQMKLYFFYSSKVEESDLYTYGYKALTEF